jgi:hypothetical protein
MRPGRGMMNFEFTFDLFVCAAILTLHRDKICQSTDAASVYGCLNRLAICLCTISSLILESTCLHDNALPSPEERCPLRVTYHTPDDFYPYPALKSGINYWFC